MKFFRWTLATIVAAGLVFVGGGLLLPATTHVERSVLIERSPQQVFATLDSFARFNAWSPWAEYDPQARYTFEGPARGAGARMRWVGNRAVGSGSQEIVASQPHSRIVDTDVHRFVDGIGRAGNRDWFSDRTGEAIDRARRPRHLDRRWGGGHGAHYVTVPRVPIELGHNGNDLAGRTLERDRNVRRRDLHDLDAERGADIGAR